MLVLGYVLALGGWYTAHPWQQAGPAPPQPNAGQAAGRPDNRSGSPEGGARFPGKPTTRNGMAEQRTKDCEDCGVTFLTRRSNTKFCRVCRVYRDLAFIGERKKTCLDCSVKFAPLARNDVLCGKCDPITYKAYAEGTCSFCHQDTDRLLSQDISVCVACARDAGDRERLLKAVLKKRKARAADPATYSVAA